MDNVKLKAGRFCKFCVALIPGELDPKDDMLPRRWIDWTTLKSIEVSARSCDFCAMVLYGRPDWIRTCQRYSLISSDEAEDSAVIDNCELNVEMRQNQKHGPSLFTADLRVYLRIGKRSFAANFTIIACDADDPSTKWPIWTSYPTTPRDKLSRISKWYRECLENHAECQPRDVVLPTRLIDVGSENGPEPRLVYSKDLDAQDRVLYAALSYCWGDSLLIRTTRAKEARFRSKIAWRDLPKTFQEGIAIARMLQIPYIWIDALCIIQGDILDWQQQAARMQQVYYGATLTISASGATDTTQGFFAHNGGASIPSERSLYSYNNSRTGNKTLVQIQNQSTWTPVALQRRGWVLQESVLSHRLIQCVQSEICWRCNVRCVSESGVIGDPTAENEWNVPALNKRELRDAPWNLWWRLVEDFSERAFTFPKDRLAAMAGLINHFATETNHRCGLSCLGMWKGMLHRELAWAPVYAYPRTPEKLTQANHAADMNLPSWTWLSSSKPVVIEPESHGSRTWLRKVPTSVHHKLHIVEYQVSWSNNPYTSTLNWSRLLVKGPVLRSIHVEIPEGARQFEPWYCLINGQETPEPHLALPWRSTVQFDVEEYKDEARPAQAWTCLFVRSVLYDDQENRNDDIFLLLEPAEVSGPEANMTFRRVGILISRDNDKELYGATTEQTLSLV